MKEEKRRFRIGNKIWCIAVFLMACVGFLAHMGFDVLAADESIPYDIYYDMQAVTGDTVNMRTRVITLYSDIAAGDTFQWTSLGDSVEIVSGENSQNVRLRARTENQSTIQLIITHADGTITMRTCIVNVVFCLDESKPCMKYINAIDTRKSIVMDYEDELIIGKDLDLVFGDVSSALWVSENPDVISISGTTVTARGAGRTTLSVSCDDGAEHWVDTVDVYVRPEISYGGDTSGNWILSTGAIIDATMRFDANPVLGANDKLTWVIYREVDGSNVLVRDARGNQGEDSDLANLSYSSINGGYTLRAKAGNYFIAFYVAGTYTNFEDAQANQPGCAPVVAKVTVVTSYEDKEINLSVGGTYNLPDAFNIRQSDFIKNFYLTNTDPTNPYTQYCSYSSTTGTITATKTGTAKITVTMNGDLALPGLTEKTVQVTIVISESFTLNHSSYTMYVGATLELNGVFSSGETPLNSTFEWRVSNDTYAVVEGEGMNAVVTAKKKTDTNAPVVVTLAWTDEYGKTNTANCIITIKESIQKIVLNPSTVEMNTSSMTYVSTDAQGETNFRWFSSNTDVVQVEPAAGNTSAKITSGKIPGSAIITVINMDNNVYATCEVTVTTPITKISIDKAPAYEVKLIQKFVQMVATYQPTDATNVKMTWLSSDTSVATVNDTGLIELKKPGVVIISVMPTYNPNLVSDQCILTITSTAEGLQLSDSSISLEVGNKYKLNYTLTPEGAKSDVTFRSLDEKIATVDQDGTVHGVAGGSTVVYAVTGEGSVQTCNVKIIQGITSMKADKEELEMSVGEVYQSEITWEPQTATETNLTWTSKNTKVVTVDNKGLITAKSAGDAYIVVSARPTATTSCEPVFIHVTVKTPLESIALVPTSKTITVGTSFDLTVTYKPENATNKKVTFTSSDTKIAKVDEKGKVTGVAGGMVMITCKAEDGGYLATCMVTVEDKNTTITLDRTNILLSKGKRTTLVATVKSNFKPNQSVKWTTTKKKIATVNSKGVVYGKKIGTTKIRATATDGTKAYAECYVRVIKRVTSVSISKNYITLVEGRSKKLKCGIKPKKATIKGVRWTTSDKNVAIVSSSGKVTAIAEGMCEVTVSATDGSGKKATCIVKVTPLVPATSIVVGQQNIIMVRGQQTPISIRVLPSNSTDSVSYVSDNRRVATVSKSGVVTAVRAGEAIITIMTSSGQTATVNVTVVALNKTSVDMRQYDTEYIWVDGANLPVTWFSANPRIATVDSNGMITGKKKGTTTVYASLNGVRLACKVRVRKLK